MRKKTLTKNNTKDIFWTIIFCLAFVTTILIFSYRTTLFFFPLTESQENTIHFLQGKEELRVYYTPGEISHLEDVAQAMNWLQIMFYVGVILSLAILIYHLQEKEKLIEFLFWGGITVISVIVILTIVIGADFNAAFIIFHKLFFPQGNWTFPVDSTLVKVFPETFFIHFSRFMFLPAAMTSLVSILLSTLFKYYRKKVEEV